MQLTIDSRPLKEGSHETMSLMYVCTAQDTNWKLIAELNGAAPQFPELDDEARRRALEKAGYAVQILRVDEAIARQLPISLEEADCALRGN